MATKREWLITQGLAKEGRGKFSNAAKEALAKAEAEGIVFDDSPAPSTPKPVKDKPVKESAPVVTADDVVMFENEMPHYGVSWNYRDDKGKKMPLSDRAVCINCGYSLIAHVCNSPKVLAPAGVFVMAGV